MNNNKLSTFKGILIIRLNADLYFANSQAFVDYVQTRSVEKKAEVVILDASVITSIDLQGAIALEKLFRSLLLRKVEVLLVHLSLDAHQMLHRSGALDVLTDFEKELPV